VSDWFGATIPLISSGRLATIGRGTRNDPRRNIRKLRLACGLAALAFPSRPAIMSRASCTCACPRWGHRRSAAHRPLRGVDDLPAAPYAVAPEGHHRSEPRDRAAGATSLPSSRVPHGLLDLDVGGLYDLRPLRDLSLLETHRIFKPPFCVRKSPLSRQLFRPRRAS
jgi:hypothetical protein